MKKLTNSFGVAAFLLIPLRAATTSAAEVTPELSSPVSVPGILGFGASLTLVIASIVIVGWLYARMQGGHGGNSSVINILASQSLGSKEKIVLVEVGDKQIVVGMTAANVQTLHVFDEPVIGTAERPPQSVFAERLLAAVKGARK